MRRLAWGIGISAILGATGCRLAPGPMVVQYQAPTDVNTEVYESWERVFAHPADVEVQTIVGANWATQRKGIINLKHPEAKSANLKNEMHPVVVSMHVIRHASRGDYLVDTGIDSDLERGGHGPARGIVRSLTKSMEPVISVATAQERYELDIQGVFLTHAHFDHVLGLPDIPLDTPIYTGPGELHSRHIGNGFLRRSYRQIFNGREEVLEFQAQRNIEGLPAVDVLGDGSIWALLTPGHTPGSVSYLINAKSGPVLLTGDTSHTNWGWEHSVEPGTYTADSHENRKNLLRLKALVARYPQVRVVVGHELPGHDATSSPIGSPKVSAGNV